ncbi:MAG: FtsH protease activity modulator HflK [Chloroflexi bacterium]|nr:FtsH protease activity modulator HflK [Chloroflexota bacterium]
MSVYDRGGPQGGPPDDEDNEDFGEMLRQTRDRAKRLQRFIVLGIIVAAVLWIGSGVYIVGPAEQGVVLQFGRHVNTTSPGVNYHLPWPIQNVVIVDIANVRRAEIGQRTVSVQGSQETRRILEEALMLTADENIVEVGLLVQYRVTDAAAFVFNVNNPEAVLHTTTEVALRSAVGKMPIDGVITERRAEVQENTRAYLQELMDEYNAGISITDVRLQVADAPDQVRDAFHEVVRAREDRERKVNEAQAYREDVVPRARGEAKRLLEQAQAYREERVRSARGESERFLSILEEYRRAPEVTRERMYIEAVEQAMADVEKVLIAPADSGVLPFLPLRSLQSGTQPSSVSQ